MYNLVFYPSQYEHINRNAIYDLILSELKVDHSISNLLYNYNVFIVSCSNSVDSCYLNYSLVEQDHSPSGYLWNNNFRACHVCLQNQLSVATYLERLGAKVTLLALPQIGDHTQCPLPNYAEIITVITQLYIRLGQFVAQEDLILTITKLAKSLSLNPFVLANSLRSSHSVITSFTGESILSTIDQRQLFAKINSWLSNYRYLSAALPANCAKAYIFNGRFEIASAIRTICSEREIKYRCFESGHQYGFSCTTGFFTDCSLIQDLGARSLSLMHALNNDHNTYSMKLSWGRQWLTERIHHLRPTGPYKQFIDSTYTDDIPDQRYDLYLSTSQYEFTGCDSHLPGESGYESDILKVLASLQTDTCLVIRFHPNSAGKDLRYNKHVRNIVNSSRRRPVVFISSDTKVNTYSLVMDASLVVVNSSLAAVEAVFLGVPCISMSNGTYSSFVPYLRKIDTTAHGYPGSRCFDFYRRRKPTSVDIDNCCIYAYAYNHPHMISSVLYNSLKNMSIPDELSYGRFYHYHK